MSIKKNRCGVLKLIMFVFMRIPMNVNLYLYFEKKRKSKFKLFCSKKYKFGIEKSLFCLEYKD